MTRWIAGVVVLLGTVAFSAPAFAHCDTTQGPVVTSARAALEAGDPALVLHWVRPEDEQVVRAAFDRTLAVRALAPEAKALADTYFFETLVRIHRAGEGAPYTGLVDGPPDPIIAATDRALATGSSDELERELVAAVKGGLAERFAAARAARDFRPGDVAAGRAFVAAYVPLTHWVEGVAVAAEGHAEHHAGAATAPAHAEHEAATPPADGPSIGLRRLPWAVAALLAIVAIVEAAVLLRRPRPV